MANYRIYIEPGTPGVVQALIFKNFAEHFMYEHAQGEVCLFWEALPEEERIRDWNDAWQGSDTPPIFHQGAEGPDGKLIALHTYFLNTDGSVSVFNWRPDAEPSEGTIP